MYSDRIIIHIICTTDTIGSILTWLKHFNTYTATVSGLEAFITRTVVTIGIEITIYIPATIDTIIIKEIMVHTTVRVHATKENKKMQ